MLRCPGKADTLVIVSTGIHWLVCSVHQFVIKMYKNRWYSCDRCLYGSWPAVLVEMWFWCLDYRNEMKKWELQGISYL